jgi:caffeyl-CoA reductase-Etf complex subunit CarE
MSENPEILVHCEVNDGKLASLAIELLGSGSRLASELGQPLCAILIGNGTSGLAQEAIAYGSQKVYVIDDPSLKDYSTELYLQAIEQAVELVHPSIILLGQTIIGRDLAPWLAFRLNTGVTMDCTALEIDPDTRRLKMTRPVYGGNAEAIQLCRKDPQIAVVRNKVMAPSTRDGSRTGEVIMMKPAIDKASLKMKVIERRTEAGTGVKLEDARVIVAGGRGIGSAEGFQQLTKMAELLHGAVGSTRPPCDAGWIPNNQQIGITGKIVSPDLYIAVGLSGASQHVAGFFSSKVVVAINKDPGANIFKVADYGIVADWKTVLPALATKLTEAM